jgi:hypothetical protein
LAKPAYNQETQRFGSLRSFSNLQVLEVDHLCPYSLMGPRFVEGNTRMLGSMSPTSLRLLHLVLVRRNMHGDLLSLAADIHGGELPNLRAITIGYCVKPRNSQGLSDTPMEEHIVVENAAFQEAGVHICRNEICINWSY